MNALDHYGSLMWTIRGRFEVIETLKKSNADSFSRAESAAFHGRKIIEAIAFACLVAIDNGVKKIPRDAKGQWNAETIFKKLKNKNIEILPSPSLIRQPSTEEISLNINIKFTIEGIPNRRLSYDNLTQIYQRLHFWLHEINPYIYKDRMDLYNKKSDLLWEDLGKLNLFVESHFVAISGAGFFCVLKDTKDGATKVIPLSKTKS